RGGPAGQRAQDPVHEPPCVLGCIPLRQRDCLVDHRFERDRTLIELVDAEAKDVPLECPELACRPVSRDGRDARVERLRVGGDRFGETAGELVDLALVVGAERLAGQVPLVEEEERRAAGCAAGQRHRPFSSTNDVVYSPLRNAALLRTSRAKSRVVAIPCTSSSPSARSARSIAAGRSPSQTISFAISESYIGGTGTPQPTS